ncbi:DUF368 domain-containing protein [Gordonia caeni]|uniref:DUF368 domain-containing protein n=1 Tax=Gordonia caeni TaxID=1007097 RepID=A0ABP7NXX0_9ACTN
MIDTSATPAAPDAPPAPRPTPGEFAGNLVRGAFIGVAETIPSVSGGTIALVTSIYSRLIAAAKNLTDVGKACLTRGDWKAAVRRVDWWLLAPIGIGVVVVVFAIAGLMESFVTEQPVASKALFMGMIAMSVLIPFLEIEPGSLRSGRARMRAAGLFVAGAAVVFTLTSLPRSEITDPSLLLVFGAAAVAVCALVLPGISGSFFLLVVGLYAATMNAVDSLDVGYLAVFAAGAIFGLVSFVRILEWVLANHHTTAMVLAAGMMFGSLRALWPWQTEQGGLQPIGDDWPLALGLFVAGAAVVAVVAVIQRRQYSADAAIEVHDAQSGEPARSISR